MNNFIGEIFAIVTTLCWGIGIFPFTEATKRIGAVPVNTYRLLFALIIITLSLLIGFNFTFSQIIFSPTSMQYFWLVSSGIIGFTLGDFFGFSSFVKLGPRLASLYTTLAPGFALFFGYLLLNESLNAIGILGIGITVAGVIWLTCSKKENNHSKNSGYTLDKIGVFFGICSAFCQGLGLTLSKKGFLEITNGHDLNAIHANWIRILGAFSAAFLFSLITGNFLRHASPVFTNKKNGIKFILLGTLFGPVLGVSFSLLAITHLKVAVAQTIFALLPVFVMPLNYLFYKEKITITSILACLVSVLGVFLLIWRDQVQNLIVR